MTHRAALATALLLAFTLPASAQSPVSIKFENGNVTLVARDAPLRTILAEWSRVGGSKIVNGDRVTGAPVTLELTNVPERQALAVLLRNVSGYVAASRPGASTGISTLDRIMVLATPPPVQTAASVATRPATPPQGQPAVRFIGGDGDEPPELFIGNGAAPGGAVRTVQVPTAARDANANANANNAVQRPVVVDEQEEPAKPPAPATVPGFSGTGTSSPGMVTPAPAPQPRNQR